MLPLLRLIEQQGLLVVLCRVLTCTTLDPILQSVDSPHNVLLEIGYIFVTGTFRSRPQGTNDLHRRLDRRLAIWGCSRTAGSITGCQSVLSGLF
jgi:hypothetical protein